jgi:hypothetical protein
MMSSGGLRIGRIGGYKVVDKVNAVFGARDKEQLVISQLSPNQRLSEASHYQPAYLFIESSQDSVFSFLPTKYKLLAT